jgi:hypothetical protein
VIAPQARSGRWSVVLIGLALRAVLGDMRDLSALKDATFGTIFRPSEPLAELEPVWESYRALKPGRSSRLLN